MLFLHIYHKNLCVTRGFLLNAKYLLLVSFLYGCCIMISLWSALKSIKGNLQDKSVIKEKHKELLIFANYVKPSYCHVFLCLYCYLFASGGKKKGRKEGKKVIEEKEK